MQELAISLPDLDGILESVKRTFSGGGMTAGGMALVAFLAGLAFARGIAQQFLTMMSLALSVLAGLYIFRHRAEVFGAYGANMSTNTLLIMSGAAALLTYFLARALINILAGFGLLAFLGSFTGWKAGMLSLLPSGVLMWLSAMVLRLVGSVYGLENASIQQSGKGETSSFGAWVQELAQKVDRTSVGRFAEKLDPYDMRATANLSRLLILWPDGRVWQQIAAKGPQTAQALNHPEIAALGRNEKVRQAIERQDFAGLMQLPEVVQTASNPELEPFLKGLALEQAMDSIVYQRR
ncbi:hypothetical protein EI77_00995 [Prosthecobacter fusiformis]|uniref:Uncharacterized protein n=1 Tax=Prosthecobacter fusiformis TaxID=48464 RepID=A0A4R7SSE7_9BACT|nr:hypothetical protein [Prosthecobacter fusiformis]TDU81685.1 hypothetical protein EI77_00995 [Prosthecobacter fusiformis]